MLPLEINLLMKRERYSENEGEFKSIEDESERGRMREKESLRKRVRT